MAPMKRAMKAVSRKSADPIKSRCKLIKEAIEEAENYSDNVKEMLCATINVTMGSLKAARHPFNDRFVTMIGEVITSEHTRLTNDVAQKEVAFAQLTPAKATREATLQQCKADSAAKAEALEGAKQAVSGITTTLKDAISALKEAQKAEKTGNFDLEATANSKIELEEAQKDSLAPLLDGSAAEGKNKKAKAVLKVGRNFHFDASLLATAEPVLLKEVSERGSFDATCLEQVQAAFASGIAVMDARLAEGAPAKAERALLVQTAEGARQAAEESQKDHKEKATAAKEAKAAADAAEEAAEQSLEDFMPDLKEAGDGLDEAKEALTAFIEGALQSFNELKDVKEDDFKEEEAPEPVVEAAVADVAESPSKRARVEETVAA